MKDTRSLRATMAGGCGRAASGAAVEVKRTAPRQGVVVQTERGSERQLNINGTMFRVRSISIFWI